MLVGIEEGLTSSYNAWPRGQPSQPMTPDEQAAAESKRTDRELDLKEREVAAKEKEVNASRWSSPLVLGLFAAALGLIGNVLVARENNRSTQQVERLHLQDCGSSGSRPIH